MGLYSADGPCEWKLQYLESRETPRGGSLEGRGEEGAGLVADRIGLATQTVRLEERERMDKDGKEADSYEELAERGVEGLMLRMNGSVEATIEMNSVGNVHLLCGSARMLTDILLSLWGFGRVEVVPTSQMITKKRDN